MAGNLTAMIAAAFSGGAAPPVTTDPYFDYTTLLLPGNGTNGAQNNTFLDGSTNNFTITRNGNTTQGTFSPFSQTGWGNYFSGSSQYLTVPNGTFVLGSNNFVIESFIYTTDITSAARCIVVGQTDAATAGGSSWDFTINQTTGTLKGVLWIGGSATVITSTNAVPLNQWVHVAFVRTGGTGSLFINGTKDGTNTGLGTSSVQTGSTTYAPSIGRNGTGSFFAGYISNCRVVIGAGASSVYNATSSSITVPTSPLTAVTNTVVLTCQSNRFVDNSSSPVTVTPSGSPTVVAFSPFNPSASWSAATYGGSGYFDGSGDYLTVPQSAGALDLGSGQFSLEFWWYPTSAATGQYPFIGESTGDWYVGVENNNIGLGRRGVTVDVNTTGFTLAANTWQHFVIARQSTGSNDTRIFVNGVLNGVGTTSQNYTIATTLRIGGQTGGSINGYLSSTNLVKGSVPAAYQTSSTTTGTQIFTPPTSPSTSVTGTQLLLNYTNAGIYDATSKNDLETVGNAQISTAISAKWGSGSMYFDGTGDFLSVVSTSLLGYGTGNFTIEFWTYVTSTSNTPYFFDCRTTATANEAVPALYINGGNYEYYVSGAARITVGAVPTNQWVHVALVRNSGTTTLYSNGTSTGTYSDSTSYISCPMVIGQRKDTTSQSLNGYIQDFRVTKGYARYTANFTPPTAAFPTL